MAEEHRQDIDPDEGNASGDLSREEKLAKLRAYSQQFYSTPHGKETKEAYRKSPQGKKVHRESVARYRAKQPDAIKRYETSEARKAYKREYYRAYRAKKKAEAQAAGAGQPQEILPPSPGPA